MLLNLNISNFAVFEKESISFDSGFNVFTGETGTGKSVLIEALFLILGERASKDFIRKGKKSAFVEAVFDISNNKKLNIFLDENNIVLDENDFLIISREILESGKTINKVNNRIVPLNIIKEIGNYLIDIYGQFGHASLFKKENHITILDGLIQNEIKPLLEHYASLYKSYNNKCEEIIYLEQKLANKDLRMEQLDYELNEIEEAGLEEFEEDNLLKEIKKLSNIQEMKKSLYDIHNILSQDDNSIINNVNGVYSILNKIINYDENLNNFLSRIDLILEDIQNFTYEINDYSDNLDIDEERLAVIENRVSLINRLKRKYGYTIDKILEYKNSASTELELLKVAESNLKLLEIEKKELYDSLSIYAEKISSIRKKASSLLEKEILNELYDLNMKNIKFKVSIKDKLEFSIEGKDSVEFLISTNVGSDLNSVQKVVSGGEASRIMLALKKISSDMDSIETMVFDEIDAGISGKTSQMAGMKMNYISNNHQIICVTHSPQIASISKNHFLIEKNVVDNNTFSTVVKLDDNKKLSEVARLLSGFKITEKSLENAKELIESSSDVIL
ncbi:DNA repair protein RecN (Recombination protein N) [Sedimentibacter acidaminivorans]|uniref:DNA repair protein RecN n=1 Tax=Sedimentibacter acidaminivorans TaxID=913099 RepID=A0ABS4GCJ5_9FIRM|nr:DNA repair protein RecN [Sedimentibacter acidaminivorans]MBP1925417.1 DNA repair protein RecN (Recombination protein N) [Sedimentibacter acidaminivorans]